MTTSISSDEKTDKSESYSLESEILNHVSTFHVRTDKDNYRVVTQLKRNLASS